MENDVKKITRIAIDHWQKMDELKRKGRESDPEYFEELGAFAASMDLLKAYTEE